ncbi:hypothetical protein L1987_73950 [Smallanthus sonchifolius]|uniref:Uncharacterized protein n=1 Tax=Smallanthus sonchifolius TaxID=185202 RepID=A0ACB9A2B9_9ASTR|nr:hypothetical protein L1987_73950 [Smallanthus sonchifolius]
MEKPIGSPSKMVIKLKIPKLGDAAAVDGQKTPEEDVIGIFSTSRKVCLECGKEFSSGKALGGHMRVHVQSGNRNPNFLKPPKTTKFKKTGYPDPDHSTGDTTKPYYMNSVNHEGKPTCSQCGKTFPSMKSLFGHMRCHPERVWRGILPPPDTPSAVAPRRRTVDDGGGGGDQVVDLTRFLSGWSVTERRGRRAVKPVAEDDDVLLEAVEDLLSLANGVGGGGGSVTESVVTQRQLKVEVTEGSNSSSLMNKGKVVMEEEIEVKIPAKLELNDYGGGGGGGGDMMKIFSDNESDGRYNNNNNNNSLNLMKKKKKMNLMNDLQPNDDVVPTTALPDQQGESKYKCSTCNKCFTSHQALGGHRSSHNKPKYTPPEEVAFSGENEKEVGFSGGFMVAVGGGVHQCKICDKIFATGQALGGHQRCHWTGISVVQAPSSQITSAGEAGSETGCDRKVLDFDLNVSPPAMMEVEEDEGGSGSGNGNGNELWLCLFSWKSGFFLQCLNCFVGTKVDGDDDMQKCYWKVPKCPFLLVCLDDGDLEVEVTDPMEGGGGRGGGGVKATLRLSLVYVLRRGEAFTPWRQQGDHAHLKLGE